MIIDDLAGWIKRRLVTVSLSFFLVAWFAFQLVILTTYGPETAKWLFYTELPATLDPGLVFSPISHDMFDYTHIIGNIAFLLGMGGLLEPYVNRWKIPAIVIAGGYLGMVLTMSAAPVLQFWPIAGASTGIMILWGYTGPKMWYELDLRETFNEDGIERFAAGVVLLAVPEIPVYELLLNGNMSHFVGMILGVLYFALERVSN